MRLVQRDISDTVSVGWTENCALGSFKLQFSFGFVTSCYVIMNISIALTIDKLKIT